jgi:hypothetical protein
MNLDLAKLHIADMLREAEQNRLARELRQADSPVIDAIALRDRAGRLLGRLQALRPNRPRAAGA